MKSKPAPRAPLKLRSQKQEEPRKAHGDPLVPHAKNPPPAVKPKQR
jgi:hypothetical protein